MGRCARTRRLWLLPICFSLMAGVAAGTPSSPEVAPRTKAKNRRAGPPASPKGMTLLEPARIDPLGDPNNLYGNPGISPPPAFQPPSAERGVTPIDPLEPPPLQTDETWILMPRRAPAPARTGDAGVESQTTHSLDAGTPLAPIAPTDQAAPAEAPVENPLQASDGEGVPPETEEEANRRKEDQMLEQIRRELKNRMVVFQHCAYQARRRGVDTLRRLEAKWMIQADGNIQALRIANVSDPQFATCLQRVGNQPLSFKPGVDLTIPTPIVFVR